jgi:hypothetical protein
MPHPRMQSRRNTPQYHACRYPCHHAISPPQGSSKRLQRHEEREEEGYRGVEVAFLESDIGREVCGFCISYLRSPDISTSLSNRMYSTYIRFVKRVEQKQHRKKWQQQAIKLQQRPSM